jgi:hypothetical protein
MRTRNLIATAIATLVALALASPVASGRRAESAATELTFKRPVYVSDPENPDTFAAEPSIRAARDGSIYIAAPTGLGNVRSDSESGGGDVIWRSDDGGKTWNFLGSLDNQQGGGDADIAPDHDSVVWGSGLTLANTTAAISVDKGENWNTNPVGALSAVVDRQWIESYKSEPFAFMTTGEIGPGTIILSRLERLPGDIPAVSNTIPVSGDDSYQWPGEIAVDEKNDFVYVAYNTADNNEDGIMVARTGLELEDPQKFKVTTTKGDSFDSFVGIDVDQAGNVYATWSERRPNGEEGKDGRTNSYVSVSKNNGESWSAPVKLNKGPRTTTFPWLVAGSKGRVAIAYYGTNARGPSPEKVTFPDRPLPKWRVWVAYSLNATDANPKYKEAAALASSAFLHEGDSCTSGTGCADGARDLLDFFQLDLDACGKIVITYTDNSRDEVTTDGRGANNSELVSFIGQKGGPKFYKKPLNPAC